MSRPDPQDGRESGSGGRQLGALGSYLRRRRLKLGSLLIAIAVISLPLAISANLESRRARFLRLVVYHRRQVICIERRDLPPPWISVVSMTRGGEPVTQRRMGLDLWHLVLAKKYLDAADSPWLPVMPDLPPPIALPDPSPSG